MDAEFDSRCPICLDTWENAAYVMPCLHQFCFGCILRWAESKAECPLCKRGISSMVHSVRADDDFSEVVITPTAEPPVLVQQAGRAPGRPDARIPHRPAASRPRVGRPLPRAAVGGLQPYVWASLFRDHPEILEPVLPWLRRRLELLFGAERWETAVAEDLLLCSLRIFGLNEEALVRLLEHCLQGYTDLFVCWLVDFVVRRCSEEARRWLDPEDSRAAAGQEGRPAATLSPAASPGSAPISGLAPSGSPAGPAVDELPSTSAPALRGDPHEELGERAAGPSSASRGRDRLHGGSRRPPKRRAGSPQASSPPRKEPRDQRR